MKGSPGSRRSGTSCRRSGGRSIATSRSTRAGRLALLSTWHLPQIPRDGGAPDGYNINGYYMFASRKVAMNGAMDRFIGTKGDYSGRYTATDVLLQQTDNEKVFDNLIPHFQHWEVWSLEDRAKGPQLVSQGGPDKTQRRKRKK